MKGRGERARAGILKRAAVVAAAVLAAPAPALAAGSAPVGEWHLDEGRGSAVADSSANGNNGTAEGNIEWVAGHSGAALSFDGSSARIKVLDNAALEPSRSVSVSAWLKSAGTPGSYRYVLAKGATGCIAASYALYAGPTGGLEFYVSANRGTAYARSPDAGTRVWDGLWHLVVGTFDGSKVQLFVDGSEIGQGTPRAGSLEYTLPDSNDFYIGDYPGCQLHSFKGTIDEVNVWSVALTPAQIRDAFDRSGGSAGPGGAGSGTSSSSQTGSNGTGGRSGETSSAPIIRRLRLLPPQFALTVRSSHRTPNVGRGTTISYTDTQAARSTFTVMVRKTGVRVHRRCTLPPRHGTRRRTGRCFVYVRLGSFNHADRIGRNAFHFAGLRGRELLPGTYRLDVVPRAQRKSGRTVSARFTVLP
jgi:Concanavalin A-like lectin/glucanases superfamily